MVPVTAGNTTEADGKSKPYTDRNERHAKCHSDLWIRIASINCDRSHLCVHGGDDLLRPDDTAGALTQCDRYFYQCDS